MPDLPYAVPSETLNHGRLSNGQRLSHSSRAGFFSKVFCRGGRLTVSFLIIAKSLQVGQGLWPIWLP